MQARRSRSALLACTAIAVLSLSADAFAQDAAGGAAATADSTALQPIVVKGKRVVKPGIVGNTPLISETSAETIRKKEIASVGDLGNTTEPGVDYIESRPGAAGGMFIRGMGGARIATLIDDIPVPYLETLTRTGAQSPTTGISDSSNSFDFASLSSVDVLRGSDSSRIGPGALGGALILRTLEPEDLIGEGRDWGGLAKTGYDGQDSSFNGSVAVAKRFGNTSVLFQGGYKRGHERENQGTVDRIGSLRTVPNPMDSKQSNFLFKVRQDLEGGHRIGLTAERFARDTDSDLKTLMNGTTYRPGYYWGFDDTTRERVSLDYDYQAPEAGGLIDAAKFTLYWQRLTKDSGSNATRFANGTPTAASWRYDRENQTREGSFGLTGGTVSEFETGTLSHSVRLGGNLSMFQYDQFVTSIGGTSATSPSASQADVPDVDGTRLGLFAEDEIVFGDSGFTLTPGLRFDWYDYNPKSSAAFTGNTGFGYFGLPEGQSGTRLSPKLLASYQATQELELFAQWSMSYRAPTVTELYSNFTNTVGGYTVLGNPDLKAETGQGFEIGANYDAGDFTGKVTLFHNKYRNFIDTTEEYSSAYPAGYFPQGFLINSWANRNRVEMSGVELKARKEFANGLYVNGSLAYTYGKDKETGEFIRSVAPLKSIVGVGYQQETWGLELSGVFSAAMRDDADPKTFDAPGYGIANFTTWWEPEQFQGLRVQAGVYNIFDKKYWNAIGVRDIDPTSFTSTNQPVDFYSEAGRTFKVSLTQRF
ncbi:TonB-dependent hemoglobin/transferrin/lactoferrin family receptor [Shinella zoogloeoides]|jgi:hemoglobin/transferrin/lactoferrin receptor protein|uniref:TonB-dependent hemoglobin/transferrin/lactoferrin family receptor n=1 Tax=Shinella zoogloeoides TaxID=352475 RepID=UPI00274022C3|nr:TonB-dependent hemoglobin/transferrin/lactoferrin family receptor [Shinella zoogloeoides]WLR91457.1 TonB-dependent hemoglobin/transferrin/lactoferrin family receptor [Shinella zoogloeoides]